MRRIIIIVIIGLAFSCKEELKLNHKIVSLDSAIVKLKESGIIDNSLFRNIKKSFSLTEQEIYEVQYNLKKSFTTYNNENRYNEKLEIKAYRMFLIPCVNLTNEKLVKVFAYCDDESSEWWGFIDFFNVEDGGSCYFRTTINLSTKSASVILFNGRA